jgi:hypothetical protein
MYTHIYLYVCIYIYRAKHRSSVILSEMHIQVGEELQTSGFGIGISQGLSTNHGNLQVIDLFMSD